MTRPCFAAGAGHRLWQPRRRFRRQPRCPLKHPQAFTPVPGYVPGPIAVTTPVRQSNTLLKVLVACVLFLFVGVALALTGLWYGARTLKEKADAAEQSPGLASVIGAVGGLAKSVASDDGPTEFKGNPCRLLSPQEVSQAIGVTVIRAQGEDAGCSYIARGDPADMTARHATSMVTGLAGTSIDAKTQKTIQSFAGGLFAQQEAQDKSLSAQAAKGEVPVLAIMFTVGNAEAQMKLNRSGFTYISQGATNAAASGTGDLDGIGDEAYLAGRQHAPGAQRRGPSPASCTPPAHAIPTTSSRWAKLAASRL